MGRVHILLNGYGEHNEHLQVWSVHATKEDAERAIANAMQGHTVKFDDAGNFIGRFPNSSCGMKMTIEDWPVEGTPALASGNEEAIANLRAENSSLKARVTELEHLTQSLSNQAAAIFNPHRWLCEAVGCKEIATRSIQAGGRCDMFCEKHAP